MYASEYIMGVFMAEKNIKKIYYGDKTDLKQFSPHR